MAGGGLPPPTSAPAAITAADGPIPPFPLAKAVILAITVVNESLCANMLLPFIGLFVAHLQGKSAEEAGFASGFLVAVFQLGQVFAGKRWGHLSDKYGRKPALQGGLICSGIIMLLFGLSPNIYISVVLRFMHGLANGNVLVAKAMIPEVMGHKAHEAKGYTIPSLTWCLGTLVGPAIGGALYDPTRYSWFPLGPDSIFGTNPAFLPSLVIGCYSFFALAVCTLFLQETNVHAQPLPWAKQKAIIAADASPTSDDGNKGAAIQKAAPAPLPKTKFGYKQAFQHPLTSVVLIVYMVISFCDIAFFEVLPLWAVAGWSYGGLSMASETVGLVILINGIPGMTANLFFSTALNKAGGPIKLFRIASVIWMVANCALPYAHAFEDRLTCLGVLSVILTVRVLGAAWSFSTCFLLIGRSAPPGHLGSLNGIGQSVGCMTRTLAPILVAPIFAWSIQEERPFPFNYHLAFLVGWLPLLVNFPLVARIANDPIVLGLDSAAAPEPNADNAGSIEIDVAEEGEDGAVTNATFTASLRVMQYEDLVRHASAVPHGAEDILHNPNVDNSLPRLSVSPPPPTQPTVIVNRSFGKPPTHPTNAHPTSTLSASTPHTPHSGPLPHHHEHRRFLALGVSPTIAPELVLMEVEDEANGSTADRPSQLSI